jgi:hypothetical protein
MSLIGLALLRASVPVSTDFISVGEPYQGAPTLPCSCANSNAAHDSEAPYPFIALFHLSSKTRPRPYRGVQRKGLRRRWRWLKVPVSAFAEKYKHEKSTWRLFTARISIEGQFAATVPGAVGQNTFLSPQDIPAEHCKPHPLLWSL